MCHLVLLISIDVCLTDELYENAFVSDNLEFYVEIL